MWFDAVFSQSLGPDGKIFSSTHLLKGTLLHGQADGDLEATGVGGGATGRGSTGGSCSRYDAGGRQSGQGSECELHCLYVNE